MTAITAETATIPAKSQAKSPAKVPAKPGLLARLWRAFVESRMRQAEREIAMYRHLVPAELQLVGERLAPRTEKELPFSRGT